MPPWLTALFHVFGRLGHWLTHDPACRAAVITIVGGAIGILITLPLNFVSTGTANFVTFSEIAFNFRVTPRLMLAALIFGSIIGFIGSLLPSIRAARFKIVDALRAA